MNKRFVTAKCAADIPEELREHIVCDRVDSNIVGVSFKIGNKVVKVEKGESYSNTLRILVEALPEKVKKYKIAGLFAGLPVNLLFDDEDTAQAKLRDLEYQRPYDYEEQNYTLTMSVEEVEVEPTNF